MQNFKRVILAAAALLCTSDGLTAFARENPSDTTNDERSPVYGVSLPAGYRHWEVISVAHEAGNNNDIRAILGNEIAMKAVREGMLPYPDGAIIVRLAYEYTVSERNNAIFGREQSFVAGNPTNVQVEIKDSKKYPDTAGWGYGQFENGKANTNPKIINSCFACHIRLPQAADLVFTSYSK